MYILAIYIFPLLFEGLLAVLLFGGAINWPPTKEPAEKVSGSLISWLILILYKLDFQVCNVENSAEPTREIQFKFLLYCATLEKYLTSLILRCLIYKMGWHMCQM